jgi:hypothetical protein
MSNIGVVDDGVVVHICDRMTFTVKVKWILLNTHTPKLEGLLWAWALTRIIEEAVSTGTFQTHLRIEAVLTVLLLL